MIEKNENKNVRPAAEWQLSQPYGVRTVLVVIIIGIVMLVSGKNSQIDHMFYLVGEAVGNLAGANEKSQVVDGTKKIASSMFPLRISEFTEISRIENFDSDKLPRFTQVIARETTTTIIDPATLALSQTTSSKEVLYHPFGYLLHVSKKMLETIEIAIWATFFSILIRC